MLKVDESWITEAIMGATSPQWEEDIMVDLLHRDMIMATAMVVAPVDPTNNQTEVNSYGWDECEQGPDCIKGFIQLYDFIPVDS